MDRLHRYECSIKLVEYNKDDFYYEGHINLIPSVVGGGKTYQEAYEELYGNLDAYLDFCDKESISYPKPDEYVKFDELSGRITVRFPKSLHYDLIEFAKNDGMSINSIIIDATRDYLNRKILTEKVEEVINSIIEKSYSIDLLNTFFVKSKINQSNDYEMRYDPKKPILGLGDLNYGRN